MFDIADKCSKITHVNCHVSNISYNCIIFLLSLFSSWNGQDLVLVENGLVFEKCTGRFCAMKSWSFYTVTLVFIVCAVAVGVAECSAQNTVSRSQASSTATQVRSTKP